MIGRLLAYTLVVLTLTGLLAPAPALAAEPKEGRDLFKGLKFRPIGPSVGGRVSRACGVPGAKMNKAMARSSRTFMFPSIGLQTWQTRHRFESGSQ